MVGVMFVVTGYSSPVAHRRVSITPAGPRWVLHSCGSSSGSVRVLFTMTYDDDQRHNSRHRHEPALTGSNSAVGCGVSHTTRTTALHTAPGDELSEA